jgi:hypothetical protein
MSYIIKIENETDIYQYNTYHHSPDDVPYFYEYVIEIIDLINQDARFINAVFQDEYTLYDMEVVNNMKYKYIDDAVSKTKYKLPARRFIGGGDAQYGYKRYKEDFENLVIAIDTSGSITKSMIEQFLSETMKITEDYNPQKTVILYCDTQVYTPDILEPGDSPDFSKIAGGGGTNFWPPFKWVEKNMLDEGETPTVFIYFTDGFATFPTSSEYGIDSYDDRCIWVFLSFNGDPYGNDQPFGERIDITLANKEVETI